MKAVNLLPDDHLVAKSPIQDSRSCRNRSTSVAGSLTRRERRAGLRRLTANAAVTVKQRQLTAINAQMRSFRRRRPHRSFCTRPTRDA